MLTHTRYQCGQRTGLTGLTVLDQQEMIRMSIHSQTMLRIGGLLTITSPSYWCVDHLNCIWINQLINLLHQLIWSFINHFSFIAFLISSNSLFCNIWRFINYWKKKCISFTVYKTNMCMYRNKAQTCPDIFFCLKLKILFSVKNIHIDHGSTKHWGFVTVSTLTWCQWGSCWVGPKWKRLGKVHLKCRRAGSSSTLTSNQNKAPKPREKTSCRASFSNLLCFSSLSHWPSDKCLYIYSITSWAQLIQQTDGDGGSPFKSVFDLYALQDQDQDLESLCLYEQVWPQWSDLAGKNKQTDCPVLHPLKQLATPPSKTELHHSVETTKLTPQKHWGPHYEKT